VGCGRLFTWRVRVDIHRSVDDLQRVALHVVCPRVERVPIGEFEACVVPVAGEDTLLDAPLREREPHMRAAVVHRAELALVEENRDRCPLGSGHCPTLLAERLGVGDGDVTVGNGLVFGHGNE